MSETTHDPPGFLQQRIPARLIIVGRRAWRGLRWGAGHAWQVALRSDGDHIFMFAAGIAFNILMALVPTILVIFFILGSVLDSKEIMAQLNELAGTYIVSTKYPADLLEKLHGQIAALIADRGIAGAIGVVGLLWSASALASSIRESVNRVMRCREMRNFFVYKLYDMIMIMLIGILVFVSIVTGPLLQLLITASDRIGSTLHLSQFTGVVTLGINSVVVLILFYIIFRYMPYQRQERHIILVATLVSTALWELARFVFELYITQFGSLTRVYGAYTFFAAAALWIYVSSLLLLIGAEVAYHVKQSRWNARRSFARVSAEAKER